LRQERSFVDPLLNRRNQPEADLEQVPKKVIDFFDQDMLQLFESERFLFDQMIPSDREAL